MIPDFFDRSLYEWIAYILLITGFIIAMFIQFGFYFKLVFLKEFKENIQEKPVSILLSVRNEEERIEKLLLCLLNQQYQDYEVIVVDNFSEDNTLTIIGALSKKYPRLKFSALSQELRFSEKMAVNLALKAAHYEWVIFLSPGAEGISPDFLQKINNEITDEQSLALNYINYIPRKSFYNTWCRIERFYSFLTSAAYSLSGILLFFQQSNVLFRKQFYFESAGFKGRMNDDFANMELLFNTGKKNKVVVSVDPDTSIREDVSLGKTDFTELVQKRIQIKKNFSLIKRMILGLEDFAAILLFTSLVWLLITEIQYWFIFSIPVIIVLGVHLFIVKSLQNRLSEKKIFISSFIYLLVRPVISAYYRTILAIQMQRNKWI
jgi:glycosyltransferase involved in cell wall biosynthesis